MARYVVLLNWTEQGVGAFQDTVDRARSANEVAQKMGGSMDTLYWTMGPYDIVAMSEFPDDETATAFALAVSAQGNVRTTTMRAFDQDEFRDIIGKVG